MALSKPAKYGLGGTALAVAAAGAFFALSPMSEDSNTAATPTPQNTAEQGTDAAQTATRATQPQAQEAEENSLPLFTFTELVVTRPNDEVLTVTAIASCGALADDFNLNNANQLAAYEQACRERTRAVLQFNACSSNNMLAAIPTNNREIKGLALGRDASQIGDKYLWNASNVASAASHNMNSYTVTHIDNIEAAQRYDAFVRAPNCGDMAFRPNQ